MSYPINDYTKGLFTADTNYPQTIDITVYGLEETFTITEKDIEQGGLSIIRQTISGGRLQVGSATAGILNLRLKNTDGRFNGKKFEGAEVFLNLGIFKTDALQWENAQKQYIPLGYFIVDNRPAKINTISLTAYDRMAKFDKKFNSVITLPTTLKTLLLDACSKCGVDISSSVDVDSLPNINAVVSELPDEENLTYKSILLWICELTASCAYIDWDGKLRMAWYSETALPDKITLRNRYTSALEEQPIVVTGVAIQGDETTVIGGTEDYSLEIVGNELAQGDLQGIADNISTAIAGTSYTPFNASCKGYPWIYPLDRVVFIDKEGTEHEGLITYHKFTMNGRSELRSDGESAQSNGYASSGVLTKFEKQALKTIKKQAERDLTTREQALINFNKTIANSMGLYTTTITLEDGSKKFYQHDKATLELSSYISTETSGGFAYTNSGWNGGEPVWQFGVDSDGNAIYKSVTAEYINALGITAKEITIKDSLDNIIFEAKGEGVDALVTMGGWTVSQQGLTSKGGEQWVEITQIPQTNIDTVSGMVNFDSLTKLYVIRLVVNREIRILGSINGMPGIFTNNYPVEGEKLVKWNVQLLYNDYVIPDTNNYAYLVIPSTTYLVSLSVGIAPATKDIVGLLPGDAPDGYAGLVWGTTSLMPAPKKYGASRIRLFSGYVPGQTPEANESTPFYSTESGYLNVNAISAKEGIYNEGSDGKFVFIKDGEITFGKKDSRNIMRMSFDKLTADYYYGEAPISALNMQVTYGYPNGYTRFDKLSAGYIGADKIGMDTVNSSSTGGTAVTVYPVVMDADGKPYRDTTTPLTRYIH